MIDNKELYKQKHVCLIADKKIDKYNYEATCSGCKIEDYEQFERHRNNELMLLIGVLGIYFLIGMFCGVVGVILH